MVLREANDPLNQSRGIMGPLENSAVANNRGRLRQRFDLIRKLGQGTYGKVQLGIDKETGQEVAIKTIKKSKIETEADLIRIRREIQIMSSVRHPNIIHIYEVFENREKMVLVMEYAAGGELYDYLNERKVLQEDEARRIFRQIASAVYYCHKHKICHRDLKLENILLDENTNAKIADFGLSNVFDDINLLKTFCGSPLYASPEIVRGTPYYGPEVDCWSLGVLLYTLVYGAMPFDGSNFKRLVKQISNGDYYEPKKPAEASRLIKCMLTVDPVKRASIKDVCAHQWINQGFDKQCLASAEELANQTPVRLDLLLSVAPQHNINHSQVVIACDQGPEAQQGPNAPSSSSETAPPGPSSQQKKISADKGKDKRTTGEAGDALAKPTAAVAPFEKPARSSINSKEKQQPAGPSGTPSAKPVIKDVKHKPAVKKKSKSSPILELIVDEEEEKERLEDIIDVDGADDDDAGDTLSEISEIQTIAEDAKEVAPPAPKTKAKVEPKPVEVSTPKDAAPTVEKKPTETEIVPPPAAAPAPTLKTPKPTKAVIPQKTEEPQPLPLPTEDVALKPKSEKPKISKPKDAAKETKEIPAPEPAPPPSSTQNESKPVESDVTPAPAKVDGESNAAKPPTVIKKKVIKQKTVDKDKDKEKSSDGVEKSKPTSGNASATGSSSSLASSAGRSGTKLDKESKTTKLRNRSDSNSSADASPTRVERRSSKIISQKTAELIQNLETKTSTSSNDSSKPKKLVFPSLKVSDAKRAFEKPPKAVKEPASVSSSPPKSKTDEKAGAEPKKVKEEKLTVTKPKKPKSKSPSPAPDKQKETDKGKPEVAEASPTPTPVAEPTPTAKPTEPKASLETPAAPSAKQKSPSPKPDKSTQSNIKLTPKAASPGTKSPEPPSEASTVDDTKSEGTLSGFSTTTATATTPKAASSTKTLKLKIQQPGTSHLDEQQVKPVYVDTGKGPPKQGLMLIGGKTTPPVRSTVVDVDSSVSTEPFFSSADAAVPTATDSKRAQEPNVTKEQAVKKISSVISRIASSESAERIMREDQEKPKKTPKNIKTEVEKFVAAAGSVGPQATGSKSVKTQRTEVSFPVAAAPSPTPQERIIPIKFEEGVNPSTPPTPISTQHQAHPLDNSSKTQSAPNISRTIPKRMEASTSTVFSRQNSSDTESSTAPPPMHRLEPIKKSPREFIIPIKLETSGQTLTPKDDLTETSLSEDPFRMDSRLRSGRFGRHKRYSSLLSDSSFDEEPGSVSVSASTSRRPSSTAPTPCHARSHSQGDEPDNPMAPLTMKHRRSRRSGGTPLDRSDSFSSAEEDEEDAFEVLTAESLFSSLLDRVRNLTKRINREDGTNWPGPDSPGFGMWTNTGPLREFMSRAPSEARSYVSSAVPASGSYSMTRSYSREPSVSVTISSGPGWRRSLSREMSGDSDSASAFSEAQSTSGSNLPNRNFGLHSTRGSLSSVSDSHDLPTVRPYQSASTGRRIPFSSQKSEPYSDSPSSSHLASSYNPPTARPYNRSLSNNEYATSVTLPFRRSLKNYDRPNYDYTSPSTTTTATSGLGNSWDSNYSGTSSTTGTGSGLQYGGGPPHRSNSVMARYTSGNSLASGESGISSPYSTLNSSRYTRSLSRAKGTPDPEPATQRYRDFSIPRHAAGDASSSSLNSSSGIPTSSSRLPGESNGWVGGSNSSSVKTAAAATETMLTSTQEKMKNYNNYYQSLNQNPSIRYSKQPSPAIAPVEKGRLGYRNGGTDVSPSKTLPELDIGGPHSSFRRPSPSKLEEKSTFEVSHIKSTPTLGLRDKRAGSIGKTIAFNPSSRDSTPAPAAPPTEENNSISTSSNIPKWPTMTPKIHRPVNVPPLAEPPISPPTVSPVHQSVRTTSDAPILSSAMMGPPSVQTNPGQSTLPRSSRATSVEKITRLLERKSMSRDRVVSPPPPRQNMSSPPPIASPEFVEPTPLLNGTGFMHNDDAHNGDTQNDSENKKGRNESPEKSKPVSKSNKPKFIQSLEKKWEKLKSPAPSPVNTSDDNRHVDDNTLSLENGTKLDSESLFLQRAVSPEKKPKSKFGASTVNFMLGKFRRIEESSTPNAPVGKPPAGGMSKIGRRIQSAYAGACSDSVLTLPQTMQLPDDDTYNDRHQRISPVKSLSKTRTEASGIPSLSNGNGEQLSKSKRPVSLDSYTSSNSQPPDNCIPESSSVVPSLSSNIPRFHRSTSVANHPSPDSIATYPASETKLPGMNRPSAPTINITSAHNYDAENGDDNPLTPNSISDSMDSSSVCSEKTDGRSVLDDEESVSDRIFRKSFYPRFNSLDRKRSSSVTSAGPRILVQQKSKSSHVSRSSLSPGNTRTPGCSSINNNFDREDFSETCDSMSSSMHAANSKGTSPHKLMALDEESLDQSASMKINKYNPNPLFKELITDEFKSDVGRKAEYSRRVTSKLSKLLREIESDIGSSGINRKEASKAPTMNGNPSRNISAHNGNNSHPQHWKSSSKEKQSTNSRIPSDRNSQPRHAPLVKDEIDDICNCEEETFDL